MNWIHIDERFPYDNERVLVSDGINIYIGKVSHSLHKEELEVMIETQQCDTAEFVYSKWWMPLPKPKIVKVLEL